MHVVHVAGYMYAQGVTEAVLGAATAVAGLMGITGTFLFTRVRKRLGLERTGVIAFLAEISCLTLAVASIWVTGSPFDMHYKSRAKLLCNHTDAGPRLDLDNNTTMLHRHPRDAAYYDMLDGPVYTYLHKTGEAPIPYTKHDSHPLPVDTPQMGRPRRNTVNVTWEPELPDTLDMANDTWYPDTANSTSPDCSPSKPAITMSVIIFLIGIVLSRIGMWFIRQQFEKTS